jgi:signal transduction histidine kinase
MRPRPFSDGGIKLDQTAASPRQQSNASSSLADTADFLAHHGRINAVWLDQNLTVQRVVGTLATFIKHDHSIIDSLPALVGHEEELMALRKTPEQSWDIPNVSLIGPNGPTPKLNISVFWRPTPADYVVLIGPVLMTQMPDVENLMRQRLIAEEKLRETTSELQRINRDLEEFTYIISHDLKAPLRALKFLSSDVVQALDHNTVDLEAARAASTEMIAQSKRMSAMLLGLLEYAQLGRKQDSIEMTDTRLVVSEIIASLRPPSSMRITLTGQWPKIETLAVPLDLVLRNLISNALKHHDRDAGEIELSAAERDAYFTFSVIDDGPGIAPDWHDAVFLPFRTVEGDQTPPTESSGIGLALVKRATESAGGYIELASLPAVKRGTTFTVFWPKSCAKA